MFLDALQPHTYTQCTTKLITILPCSSANVNIIHPSTRYLFTHLPTARANSTSLLSWLISLCSHCLIYNPIIIICKLSELFLVSLFAKCQGTRQRNGLHSFTSKLSSNIHNGDWGNVINAKMNVLMMAGVVKFFRQDKILHICEFCGIMLCYISVWCHFNCALAPYSSYYSYAQSVMKRFSPLEKVIKKTYIAQIIFSVLGVDRKSLN